MPLEHIEEPFSCSQDRMLWHLEKVCRSCIMCPLGHCLVKKNNETRDPHVFSNLSTSRYFVVGQNPGWTELYEQLPLVGPAGDNFDDELYKNGASRHWFYITNIVKCWTQDGRAPTEKETTVCGSILQLEIDILNPRLIIALDAVVFEHFCPGVQYSTALGDITMSQRFALPVYAIYHPSPRNLSNRQRMKDFQNQVAKLVTLIRELEKQDDSQN